MTVDNYFQLTFHLVSEYINSIFPTGSNYSLKHTTNEGKLKQSELYHNEERILICSFTEITKYQSLVNLINAEGRLDNALINWEWFDLDELKFPIKKDKIPQDLIDKFNTKFRLLIDEQKTSSIFERPSRVDEGGPTIEEETDTEELPPAPQAPQVPKATTGDIRVPPPTTRPPDMPDFEDEYEIKDHRQPIQPNIVPSIGDDDLNPPGLPRHPELKPFIDPLAAGSAGTSGGMYPTPHHPLFGQPQSGNSSRRGVPPGARFDDPYGEDNLDDLGMGLPGNLRGPGRGGPGSGPGGPPGFMFGGGGGDPGGPPFP
ncbi:uncharacterized protein SPAPADRAFT_60091 [Spathaspora passalidarum NRRL Y-27907]|uniref:PI31 proteasome regulator C-terminal domain-containing protein n=1 Tax=Spathaspora passalidarum (strain NRRL Y-27907 / 11-Y1) TaxID=619300 RepID=G3AM34_SPAPN|nr:uncharacterized protein SPAPADRAFT_60091 [Spathaspora passalidarum NRRL Y-27907]EGW32739.1 hypothetical protein SPAPADRAFT_60091 [Spathaspora passalidarum NRRL Y-27907]